MQGTTTFTCEKAWSFFRSVFTVEQPSPRVWMLNAIRAASEPHETHPVPPCAAPASAAEAASAQTATPELRRAPFIEWAGS